MSHMKRHLAIKNKKFISWLAVGAVIIAGGVLFYDSQHNYIMDVQQKVPPRVVPVAGSATTPVEIGESVKVNKQKAGDTVVINSLSSQRSLWVVVRDQKSILGAQLFRPGMSAGSVTLLRPTIAGSTYDVVLYSDNGDREFDYKKDSILLNIDSTVPASVSFEAN